MLVSILRCLSLCPRSGHDNFRQQSIPETVTYQKIMQSGDLTGMKESQGISAEGTAEARDPPDPISSGGSSFSFLSDCGDASTTTPYRQAA